MEELAEQSEGVRRIAVCRMDVDNLGHAFISGFEQENEKDPVKRMHYVTLSRTSAFSRQMSLFFKCYINGILEGLQVSIVYAGGDDVFLVGSWNDVLEAAQRIQRNFTAFSCGALTLSAGIGIFDDHYPIRLSAEETAALEEAAKHLPGKMQWHCSRRSAKRSGMQRVICWCSRSRDISMRGIRFAQRS